MIGVFDSGLGGLTILRALIDRLPQYSYCYFGDSARAPYGSRSLDEIYDYTQEGVELLFERGAQMVILGCNTASSAALRRLQQEWLPKHYPDRRLLGIVVPTIEQITGVSWSGERAREVTGDTTLTVGVIGTPATIASNVYPEEIHQRNPAVSVIQQACPVLAQLVETGASRKQLQAEIRKCLAPFDMDRLDALLLGCTHYELIVDLIRNELPPHIQLYEQPGIVAESLAHYLARHADRAGRLARSGERTFLTSGDVAAVSGEAARYFGKPITFAPAVAHSAK